MAKMYSMHEVELRPGVTAEEFERFLTQEYLVGELSQLQGWRTYYLKGTRGVRDGKYLVLNEIESVEARDRYFPEPGVPSPELQQLMAQTSEAEKALDAKFETFVTPLGQVYTNYVVIGE